HHGTRLAGDVQQSPLRILDPVQWPVAIQRSRAGPGILLNQAAVVQLTRLGELAGAGQRSLFVHLDDALAATRIHRNAPTTEVVEQIARRTGDTAQARRQRRIAASTGRQRLAETDATALARQL